MRNFGSEIKPSFMARLKKSYDLSSDKNKNFGLLQKTKYFLSGIILTYFFFNSGYINTLKKNEENLKNEIVELKKSFNSIFVDNNYKQITDDINLVKIHTNENIVEANSVKVEETIPDQNNKNN